MTAPSVSAVVITQNEDRNLPGFLRNVGTVAAQIVIVDSGSTDRTLDIAEAAGPHVVVIRSPLDDEGGFARQRNIGIDAASGDWVLNMDCDERLSPELAEEIARVLPGSALNGYRYRRLNYFMNRPMRYGGWASWNRPQIARRWAHRFVGRLHESCEIDGGEGMTGQMQGLMHHLNDFDLEQRFTKSGLYTRMEADRLCATGRTVTPRDLWWKPLREFGKKYVAQQGLRDGVPGFVAALHGATSVFRINALAWDRQNSVSRETIESELSQPRIRTDG